MLLIELFLYINMRARDILNIIDIKKYIGLVNKSLIDYIIIC